MSRPATFLPPPPRRQSPAVSAAASAMQAAWTDELRRLIAAGDPQAVQLHPDAWNELAAVAVAAAFDRCRCEVAA